VDQNATKKVLTGKNLPESGKGEAKNKKFLQTGTNYP